MNKIRKELIYTYRVGNGLVLKRWIISEQDLEIQKSIIQFIKYLYDNCSEFEDMTFKAGNILKSIISALFPYDSLNYPCDTTGKDSTKRNEEEKCHISSQLLFNLISHMLIVTTKQNNKLIPLIELIFDSTPLSINETQLFLFQSKVLFNYIEWLQSNVSRELFLENKIISTNISKFSSYVTDRICAGLFYSDLAKVFFDYLIYMLEQIEEIEQSSNELALNQPATQSSISNTQARSGKMKLEVQVLYKSLNRVTIYLLAAPYGQTRNEYIYVIENIIFHQRVVLNLWNNDTEFIYVLSQLLYNFLLDDNRKLRESSMNVWKLLLLTKSGWFFLFLSSLLFISIHSALQILLSLLHFN